MFFFTYKYQPNNRETWWKLNQKNTNIPRLCPIFERSNAEDRKITPNYTNLTQEFLFQWESDVKWKIIQFVIPPITHNER